MSETHPSNPQNTEIAGVLLTPEALQEAALLTRVAVSGLLKIAYRILGPEARQTAQQMAAAFNNLTKEDMAGHSLTPQEAQVHAFPVDTFPGEQGHQTAAGIIIGSQRAGSYEGEITPPMNILGYYPAAVVESANRVLAIGGSQAPLFPVHRLLPAKTLPSPRDDQLQDDERRTLLPIVSRG